MIDVTLVILCGDSGTLLWPLFRTCFPKQFLCLTGKKSLFQQAALRLANLGNLDIKAAFPIVINGEYHLFLALEQLRENGVELGCVLLGPAGRNTALALTLAALAAMDGSADPGLVVTLADQTVVNALAFTIAMRQVAGEAANGTIVILGVTPDKPETSYGYIQINQAEANAGAYAVRWLVEKSDAATAQAYLNEGRYFWNAGMVVLKASAWINALEQFRTSIVQATQDAWGKRSSGAQFVRPCRAVFAAVPSKSVDYAAIKHFPKTPTVMLR
ncbi:sugar phosphate nucleotidyltransferase [Pusillimonas minor]|uniref:sugar phosphate nucleotidyltransferase n=1 Tax=Pusillimonas minor TaxID=2697024 RepID=UPI00321199A0